MSLKLFLHCFYLTLFLSCQEKILIIEKWENGNIKREEIFAGKNSFVENLYYENGKLWSKTEYKNGRRNGNTIGFYRNGQKMGEATYINDTVDGKCVEYFPNGNLRFVGQQEKGKLIGLIKRYHENGRIKREETYANDTIISFREWDSLGNQIK